MTYALLTALAWLGYFLAAYLIGTALLYTVMLGSALYNSRKQNRLNASVDSLSLSNYESFGVTIVVPAFNEASGILQSVSSLLNLNYPNFEIIVVNDGSTDKTAELVIDAFSMHPAALQTESTHTDQAKHIRTAEVQAVYRSSQFPNLHLVSKHNGGKADALNCGINLASYNYVCTVDGDSLLEKNALKKVMRPFLVEKGNVAASGGSVELINGNNVANGIAEKHIEFSDNPIVAMQTLEYFRAFLIGRVALSQHNLMLISSGAFTVFERDLLLKEGGLTPNVIGEDMEIVVRLQRTLLEQQSKKRIVQVPDAICFTEAPETLEVLRKQRRRWHQGLLESLWTHKTVAFNPRYRSLGLLSFPYFILGEALIPVIELLGIIFIIASFFAGQIFLEYSLFLVVLFLTFNGLMNVLSITINAWMQGRYPRPLEITYVLGLSFTETFWYKPLMLWFRLEGFYRFFTQNREWGAMDRRGFHNQPQEVSS
ncbi:glycosyltransferase [Corynebacterium sp. 35RC1]|nr:glycosyltransferase [Corynebacterium sp. 35RC1]